MLITCKCLNITVEAKETEKKNSDVGSCTSLSAVDELESFFKEDVKEVEIVTVSKQIPSLTQGRSTGVWMVEHCLNCSVNCYAAHMSSTAALVNASLVTTQDAVKHMKSHRDFSPVFRIIIQPVADDKKFDVTSIRQNTGKLDSVLSSLQQQLRESIREEVTKTEDRIRAFNEHQYTQLEDFRNRATKDHKSLARKIYEVRVPYEKQETMLTGSRENGEHQNRIEHMDGSLSRRLTQGKKADQGVSGAVAQESEYKARPPHSRPMNMPFSRVTEQKMVGSLDSEGLFVIEGMEDAVAAEPVHSEGESDTDHEDSGSHDEGIDVHRKRTSSFQLAKSLPVNVPVYSVTPSDFDHDDEPSDAVDIAASIKALARSVHGDTVFGDLPRPRFSTQI